MSAHARPPFPRQSVPRTDDEATPNGNGHGPQSESPRAALDDLSERGLLEDQARGVELIRGRVDALQVDMRGLLADVRTLKRDAEDARLWRAQVGPLVRDQGERIGKLDVTVTRIDAGVLELVARTDDAQSVAARASREAKAAREVGERASQTNEIAIEHTKSTLALDRREHELELEAQVTALAEQQKRRAAIRKVVSKVAEHGLSVAVGGIIMAILAWKGCHP